MRPIRETIPLDEALALILEAVVPIERTERVPLGEAAGRVVANPPSASMDVPAFDRAAMDGYAVRAEDTFGVGKHDPKLLRSVEKVVTDQDCGPGGRPHEGGHKPLRSPSRQPPSAVSQS
jgi:molybdopterin molybdotransferase